MLCLPNLFLFASFLLFYFRSLSAIAWIIAASSEPTLTFSIHPPHSSQKYIFTKIMFKLLKGAWYGPLYNLTSSCFPTFILYHDYMFTHSRYIHPKCVLSHIHTLDLSHTQLPVGPQKQQLPTKRLYMLLPNWTVLPTPFPFWLIPTHPEVSF